MSLLVTWKSVEYCKYPSRKRIFH